ncbi:MAG TPA: DNA polymerase III subunit alpha [Thermotogaceae bacterium]|nr:DNA polymerase III subunit alpha [Thermotogaceae bacterium]
MNKKIIYLHFHSEYSFESLTKISETLATASKNGIEAVAITDPYFHGHVKFHSEAIKNGIVPILGLELRTSDGDFVILCENKKGYLELVSFWNEVILSKNNISIETILEFFNHLENVTLLSGHAEKFPLFKNGLDSDILQKLKSLAETGKFCIQIDLPTKSEMLRKILRLSREFGIPLVGSYNTMYLNKEEKTLFEIFRGIINKSEHENYCEFKSKKDFISDFKDLPEIFKTFEDIMNRVEIFDMKIDFNFPSFSENDKTLLRKKVFDSLTEKYGSPLPKDIKARIDRELNLIFSRNLESYFLTVKEIVDVARRLGILIGPGRGSAVGSLVSYSLGITSVDPLKHGLIFERFLNEGRSDLPDIDIDVQDSKRQELLLELKKHFGEEHFSQIITFGSYGKKLLKREIQRKLPQNKQELAFSNIEKFLGLPHHTSIHAAGIIITKENLKKRIPLLKSEIGLLTQFDMQDLEKIGVVKIDLLGLRTLTVIRETLEDSQKGFEDAFYEKLPFDDPKVFELLSKGFTSGIFQLDSRSGRNICMKVKPKSLEDISIVLALNRPGPMTSGILESYLKGEKIFNHEKINEMLNETKGMLLYQEQIMRIVSEIAGLSLVKADEFRRAIAKKELEKIQKYKKEFLEATSIKGLSFEEAENIFDKIVNFAGYAFNKSHSVAYSLLTYTTAFLKANLTPQYLKNLLNSHLGDTEKLSSVISESKLLGYKIYGIDINKSYELCSVEDNGVRIGLTFVKGLGIQKARNIIDEREKFGEYKNIEDAVVRLKRFLNDSLILELIKAGAFDSFEEKRSDILKKFESMEYDAKSKLKEIQSKVFGIMEKTEKSEVKKESNSLNLGEEFLKVIQEIESLGFILSSDLEDTIREKFGDYYPNIFELLHISDKGMCPVVTLNIGRDMVLTDGLSFIKHKKQGLEIGKIYIALFNNGKLIDIFNEDFEKLKYEYHIRYTSDEELEKILNSLEKSKNSEIVIVLDNYLIRINGYKPKNVKNFKLRLSMAFE